MAKARHTTEERRRQIVDATLALLAEHPLERLSTRRIARELGVSQPALFRHFQSREAILLATVDRARDLLGGALTAVVADGADARERMRALLETLLTYVEQHPGLPRLLFADLASDAGPLRTELTRVVAMQRALVAQLFREGQRDGSFRRDADPDAVAGMIVGLAQGLVLQWQMGGRTTPLSTTFAGLYDLWLAGVAGDGIALPAGETGTEAGVRLLDVRPILAGGRDPLDAVVRALDASTGGAVLVVVAPFRPRPLEALLTSKGHTVSTHLLAGRAWTLLVEVGGAVAVTDLRELPAPEPLEAVLTACNSLPVDAPYVAWVPRFPRLLLPKLEARGLAWQAVELEDGSGLVHIR